MASNRTVARLNFDNEVISVGSFVRYVLLGIGAGHWAWLVGWVKESEGETHTPVRAVAGRGGVIFGPDLEADWLLPDFQDLADRENERHGPLLSAVRLPVRRHLRSEGERRMRLGGISEERMEKHLADIASVTFLGDRPNLIEERARRDRTGLFQHHHGRSDAKCSGSEKWMSSSRVKKHRTDADNQTRHRCLGRKEETLRGIAQPILRTILGEARRQGQARIVEEIVLRDDR